jgi:hypothetical protein
LAFKYLDSNLWHQGSLDFPWSGGLTYVVSSPRRGMLCWKELFSFFYTLRILNSVTKNVIPLFTLHVNVFAYIYSLSFLPRLIRGFALTIFFLLPVDSAHWMRTHGMVKALSANQ